MGAKDRMVRCTSMALRTNASGSAPMENGSTRVHVHNAKDRMVRCTSMALRTNASGSAPMENGSTTTGHVMSLRMKALKLSPLQKRHNAKMEVICTIMALCTHAWM